MNGLCGLVKEMRNAYFDGRVMNLHGKPDAGKPPVRFDEGGGIDILITSTPTLRSILYINLDNI